MDDLSEGLQKFDFHAAIEDLKVRAARARRTRSFMVLVIFLSIGAAVSAVFNYSAKNAFSYRYLADEISNSTPRDPSIFLYTSRDLLNKAYSNDLILMARRMDGEEVKKAKLTSEERLAYLHEVDQLVGFYERAEKAFNGKESGSAVKGADWVSSISSVAFSFGAIALAILMLQIAISFIRYYSQLAELYDAQAGALIASDGNADRAVKFFEMFSPAPVSFGKTPITLYERAFDALTSIKGRKE